MWREHSDVEGAQCGGSTVVWREHSDMEGAQCGGSTVMWREHSVEGAQCGGNTVWNTGLLRAHVSAFQHCC